VPITSSRMGHLWDALSHAYDELGFSRAAGGDEVFRQLVLARIIEPAGVCGVVLPGRLAAAGQRSWRSAGDLCVAGYREEGSPGVAGWAWR
jgi:hypothetical protein